MNYHVPSTLCGEITCSLLNFNGGIVEIWELISNFTHTSYCNYLSMPGLKFIHISKAGPRYTTSIEVYQHLPPIYKVIMCIVCKLATRSIFRHICVLCQFHTLHWYIYLWNVFWLRHPRLLSFMRVDMEADMQTSCCITYAWWHNINVQVVLLHGLCIVMRNISPSYCD